MLYIGWNWSIQHGLDNDKNATRFHYIQNQFEKWKQKKNNKILETAHKTGWHFNWMFWQKRAQEINHSCYSNIEFHKIDICEVADGKMTVNQHQPLHCEFV